jgi:hypothetical protein
VAVDGRSLSSKKTFTSLHMAGEARPRARLFRGTLLLLGAALATMQATALLGTIHTDVPAFSRLLPSGLPLLGMLLVPLPHGGRGVHSCTFQFN